MILPSGKLTKIYGKSPFLMGKSTISMVIFNSYVKLPEGIILCMIFLIFVMSAGATYGNTTVDGRNPASPWMVETL